MTNQDVKASILDLIGKWESFARGLQTIYDGDELSEYHKGIAMGFEAAAQELRALAGQFDLPESTPAMRKTQEIVLEVSPSDTDIEPSWEYFYVTFDQGSDGTWRIKHLNGVWQPGWQSGMEFDEAVQQLRDAGWRLARLAHGIHVFRRPRQTDS
jgi:hypothetical protein